MQSYPNSYKSWTSKIHTMWRSNNTDFTCVKVDFCYGKHLTHFHGTYRDEKFSTDYQIQDIRDVVIKEGLYFIRKWNNIWASFQCESLPSHFKLLALYWICGHLKDALKIYKRWFYIFCIEMICVSSLIRISERCQSVSDFFLTWRWAIFFSPFNSGMKW